MAGNRSTTGKGATHHIIHRGRHETGGMCIEAAADDGARVLLDLGMPLQTPDGGDLKELVWVHSNGATPDGQPCGLPG